MKVNLWRQITSAIMVVCALAAWTVKGQADNIWSGNALDGLWGTGTNWSMGVVPAPGQGNIIYNDQTNGSLITLNTSATVDGDLFGPEWGMGLDIDGGSLTQVAPGFVFAPIGALGTPSVINVFNGGSLQVQELLIGDNWWFNTAPEVELNIFDTSTVTANGWMWVGGKVNLHDGVLDIGGQVNVNAGLQNNAQIDIEAGTWIVRGADISANIATWIGTGELTAYGGTGTIVVDTISVPGGTVITALVPEPASIVLLGIASVLAIGYRRHGC